MRSHLAVVRNVGTTSFTYVPFPNPFTSPVVVCTPEISDWSVSPVVARVRLVGGSGVASSGYDGFEVLVQGGHPSAGDVPGLSGLAVSCVAVEEGVYDRNADGVRMEAVVLPAGSTRAVGVGALKLEAVDDVVWQQRYASPVVLSQVMSYNDPRFQVAYSTGNARRDPPNRHHFRVARLAAAASESGGVERDDELVGYIAFEHGSGWLPDGAGLLHASMTPGSVQGMRGREAPGVAPLPHVHQLPRWVTLAWLRNGGGAAAADMRCDGEDVMVVAVASAAGLLGRQGGWPVSVGVRGTPAEDSCGGALSATGMHGLHAGVPLVSVCATVK